MMAEDKREKFFRIYANIPNTLRNDIIVVVDDKPYTWDVAYFEIKNKTALGQKILKEFSEELIFNRMKKEYQRLIKEKLK